VVRTMSLPDFGSRTALHEAGPEETRLLRWTRDTRHLLITSSFCDEHASNEIYRDVSLS
jgi:hypothetical protein